MRIKQEQVHCKYICDLSVTFIGSRQQAPAGGTAATMPCQATECTMTAAAGTGNAASDLVTANLLVVAL